VSYRLILSSTLVAVLLPLSAAAITLDDPKNFELVQEWFATDLGVPAPLGALMFSDDGATLYVVGNSESAYSGLYELPVTRDPKTDQVTDLGTATLVFEGAKYVAGLDAGLEWGPDGTLFYTYWSAHYLGERPGGFGGAETLYDMTPTTVPSSVAGLTFSPHLDDTGIGFAQMQVSSWLGDGLYNVPLTDLGGGLFEPGTAELFVTLPQQGTGAIQYVPQGLFTGNLMYVNWDYGEIRLLVIDPESGLPVDAKSGKPTLGTTNPEDIRFAHDIGVGPWGLEFDPLSLDFFVSTWGLSTGDVIMQLSGPGFENQAPFAMDLDAETDYETPVDIELEGYDLDLDDLTYAVDGDPDHGTVSISGNTATYEPEGGFSGDDSFTYVADDGALLSAPATVSIEVGGGADDDVSDDDTASDDDDETADDDDGGGSQDCTCRVDAGPGAPLVLLALGAALALIRRR